MTPSEERRRRRRWPFVLLGLLVAGAVAGYVVYKEVVEAPGDVFNPDVEFGATQEEKPTPRKGERFVWPLFGYTPSRTRYLETELDPPFRRPAWSYSGDRQLLEFPPVLANGTLYLVRNDGNAYAISAKSGRVKWKRRVGRLNASSPGYENGRLYVVTLSGNVTALRARNGKVVWRKDLGSRSESSPLALDGRVYFGSEDGTVYALRAKDGRVRWTHDAGGAVKGALAYSEGRLFFGDYSGEVTALRADNGSEIWSTGTQGRSFNRSGRFYSTAAVAFGRVYLGNTDGKVYSFSAKNGRLAWSHSTGAYVYASPAVARVPGGKPSVYIGSYDGTFYALDARTGETVWTHDAGGRISGSATIVGRVVYFADLGEKETSGLDARTGKRVFHFGRGSFTPVISDGRRLYVTGYSSLYAFEPRKRR